MHSTLFLVSDVTYNQSEYRTEIDKYLYTYDVGFQSAGPRIEQLCHQNHWLSIYNNRVTIATG